MTKQLPNSYSDYSLKLLHKDRIMFWLTGGRANTFGAKDELLRSSTGEPMYLYPYHTEALDHDLNAMTHQFNLQNDEYGHVRFSICDVSLVFNKQDHTLRPYIGGFVFDATGITEGALAEFDIVLGSKPSKPDLAVVTYDPNFINCDEYLATLCTEDQTYSRQLEHKMCDEFQQFVNNCNNVAYQKLIDISFDDFDKLNEEGIIRY